MANGECVACHARATGKPAPLWATPASYAVKMSRARGWAASTQDRGIFSRNEDTRRRLVNIAWSGRYKCVSGCAVGVGCHTLDDDLRIAESAVNKIDMIGWTLM